MPMVTAPRMPLQPGAMNMPKSGVNMRRIWSGVSFWWSAMAKARATWAETRCSGRSTKTLKTWGTGVGEQDEQDGEARGAEQRRAAEEEHDAGEIREGDERVRREVDGPARREDEDEHGLLAEADGGGR